MTFDPHRPLFAVQWRYALLLIGALFLVTVAGCTTALTPTAQTEPDGTVTAGPEHSTVRIGWKLIWQMQEIVLADVVYIVPYNAQFAQAYRTDRFTGWITDAPTLTLEDQSSLVSIEPAP